MLKLSFPPYKNTQTIALWSVKLGVDAITEGAIDQPNGLAQANPPSPSVALRSCLLWIVLVI